MCSWQINDDDDAILCNINLISMDIYINHIKTFEPDFVNCTHSTVEDITHVDSDNIFTIQHRFTSVNI